MSDTVSPTAATAAAWILAAIDGDSEALEVLAGTSDTTELLVMVTAASLDLLEGAVGLNAVGKALVRWQRQQIEEATS